MKSIGNLFLLLLSAVLGGLIAVYIHTNYFPARAIQAAQEVVEEEAESADIVETRYGPSPVPEGLDFRAASKKVTPAVVHIKIYGSGRSGSRNEMEDLFREFFGETPSAPRGNGERPMGSGSGVIVREDGYIITNNHVVEEAQTIQVVLDDKREYEATLIGTDPSTDLAVVKINADELPTVDFGNSDNLEVGEWVLAVGNPFDLTSTVTAGIVSAKARNINILRRSAADLSIESFIQTDAAVNPGNSGGALVDLEGNLVGINTAIATKTGYYAGYSFAVPIALAKKVMEDLIEFGKVQRALLGIRIQNVTADLVESENLRKIEGVYVAGVGQGSAAGSAGIERGDVITKVDGVEVNASSELQEQVARHRPGDEITVTYVRDGQATTVEVILKNRMGNTEIVAAEDESQAVEGIGAVLRPLTPEEKAQVGMSGLRVEELNAGRFERAGVPEGFIITHVDKNKVNTIADLEREIEGKRGGVLFEGVNPNGERGFYGVGF